MNTNLSPIVLYDGSCPICYREISHYQRRAGASHISWIDASNDLETLASLSISQHDAMAILHVRDSNGEWQRGVPAFLVIWSHLPAYRWLAKLVYRLHLAPVLDFGYRLFLRWRSTKQCSADDKCSTRTE